MSINTSTTSTTSKASRASRASKASTGVDNKTRDSTVRPGLRTGEHVAAVRLGAWGPQEVTVRAYSDGGRGGAPYLVVQVGTCLTYAYDQDAVQSYVIAWEAAERMNPSVRLPEFVPATATRRHSGEDLSVLCNVSAEQRSNVLSSTGPDGRRVITVTVGAVTRGRAHHHRAAVLPRRLAQGRHRLRDARGRPRRRLARPDAARPEGPGRVCVRTVPSPAGCPQPQRQASAEAAGATTLDP